MIGPFKKKSDLPEYLAHYGMFRAPFSSTLEDDMYYDEPTRKKRLDIILHLIQYTNELLVVIGEKGIGKTMFLRQLQKQAGEHWKICVVQGHKMMNEEQFLQRLYTGFGITHASVNKTAMLENLKKRMNNFLQESLPVIMIIDDADLFSAKILVLILELASLKNHKTGRSLHVILASEPQIKILLAEPELDNKHNLIIRKIDLPALDELHTGNYLNHRLSQSGMSIEQFLTRKTINKIYRQSGGIPQQINEVADNILFETTPIIRRTSNVQANKRNTLAKYAVIALLAITTLLAVFYRDLSNMLFGETGIFAGHTPTETVTPLQLPELNRQKQPISGSRAPISNPQEPNVSPDTKLSANQPGQLANSPTSSTATNKDAYSASMEKTAPNQGSSASNTAVFATIPANPGAQSQSLQAVPDQKPMQESKEKGTSSTPDIQSQNNSSNTLNDASWILAQDPAHFTLQLVTGHHQKTIHSFIKKYRLSDPQLAYFQTRRAGKIWHNLTLGVYASRKLAMAAVAKLSVEMATVKPWVRRLSSIQSEIKKSL